MGAAIKVNKDLFNIVKEKKLSYLLAKKRLIALWQQTGKADHRQLKQIFSSWTLKDDAIDIVEYLKKKKIFPEESFGKPWLGTPDKFITTAISAVGFQQLKKKALKCHISQSTDVDRFLSLQHNPLVKQEYYIFRMHGVREIFMGKLDRVASKL